MASTKARGLAVALAVGGWWLVASALVATAGAPDPVASFYQGKTVTVLVGYGPGGTFDLYARVLARHIGRHIPGKPTTIVQNMPGAGGLVLANHLYNVAPRDGTAFGIFTSNLVIEQLAGSQGIRFDAARFSWIGSITEETYVCLVRADVPVKRIEDARTVTVKMGAAGPGSDSHVFPILMNRLLGTRFQVVAGYPGGGDINLAVERGEVDGRCNNWSGVKGGTPQWLERAFVNILVQVGSRRHPDLPHVPLLAELVEDEEARSIIDLVSARLIMARPFAAPPGLPPERLAALRKAFMQTLDDPAFQADIRSTNLEVNNPLSGEQVARMVERLLQTPRERVAKLEQYLR